MVAPLFLILPLIIVEFGYVPLVGFSNDEPSLAEETGFSECVAWVGGQENGGEDSVPCSARKSLFANAKSRRSQEAPLASEPMLLALIQRQSLYIGALEKELAFYRVSRRFFFFFFFFFSFRARSSSSPLKVACSASTCSRVSVQFEAMIGAEKPTGLRRNRLDRFEWLVALDDTKLVPFVDREPVLKLMVAACGRPENVSLMDDESSTIGLVDWLWVW